jgi:hypothetical protein
VEEGKGHAVRERAYRRGRIRGRGPFLVLMVACLTRLTNDAPRWILVDSSPAEVYTAANALTMFALVVHVFLTLFVVFPLESVQETSADPSARRA